MGAYLIGRLGQAVLVVFGVVIWLGLKGWLANLPDFVS